MTNPGLYTPLDCVHHYVVATCGAEYSFITPFWIAAFIIAGVAVAVSLFLAIKDDAAWVIGGFVATVVSCGLIGAGGTAIFSPHHLDPQRFYASHVIDHERQYKRNLNTWLRETYGITAGKNGIDKLTDGKQFAVTHDGAQVVVTLVESTDGVAVQQVGGQLLTPSK